MKVSESSGLVLTAVNILLLLGLLCPEEHEELPQSHERFGNRNIKQVGAKESALDNIVTVTSNQPLLLLK